MKLRRRISLLFLVGMLAAGSTTLGYYYYFVYKPPLQAGEDFLRAMAWGDIQSLRRLVVVGTNLEEGELREPTDDDLYALLREEFEQGRILDQRKREGKSREYYYLVYRQPGGSVYALLITSDGTHFRVVIPERPLGVQPRYLWEYTWTN